MESKIRRYKEIMLWFTRDERIEEKSIPKMEGDIEIEYIDAVTRTHKPVIPEHCGTVIDMYK